jgi:hypothetical protein
MALPDNGLFGAIAGKKSLALEKGLGAEHLTSVFRLYE